MEPINVFERAVEQTGRIIAAVKADQMSAATPCSDWDVRTLLNHTIAAVAIFDGAARGRAFDPSSFAQDNVVMIRAVRMRHARRTCVRRSAGPGCLMRCGTCRSGRCPG